MRRAMPDSVLWTRLPFRPRCGARRPAAATEPGWPDFVFLLPGRAFFIEISVTAGGLPEDRAAFHKRANQMGHRCHECRSLADVQEVLVFEGIRPRVRVDG